MKWDKLPEMDLQCTVSIITSIDPFNSRVTGICGHDFNVALIRMLLIKFMKTFVKLLSGECQKTHLTQ